MRAQAFSTTHVPLESIPPRQAIDSYRLLFELTLLGSLLLPLVTVACSQHVRSAGFDASFVAGLSIALVTVLAGFVLLRRALRASYGAMERVAVVQAAELDALSPRWLMPAIAASAALSLVLELAVIRWQGSVFEFYAFYKNVGILSCFLGLGLGYALASQRAIPLFAVAPILGWQLLLLTAMRYGLERPQLESLLVNPFRENLTMGIQNATTLAHFVAVYYFLIVVFVLTALAFLPIGQLCGRLMLRREKLSAYGMNLLGSFAGVVLMLLMSNQWAPPAAWFAACFLFLLVFQTFDRRSLACSAGTAIVAMAVLAWPVSIGWERIFSPYQLIERGIGPSGTMTIRAAGHFYQGIYDLSAGNRGRSAVLDVVARYYELPYVLHSPPGQVAIVGAGTGNDVAAALRSGAVRVDAVEIDPAIVKLGEIFHPEKPYQDRRVRPIVDDARSFLRNSTESYDLIVYGLLDSHSILSQASSVRLDSFVYTVEGLREARARLKPGGILSLSFLVLTPELGRKIFLMLQEAFDGRPPLCVDLGFAGAAIFFQGRDGEVTASAHLLDERGFRDATSRYADDKIAADVSTDDWPFFYMPRRVFPMSYVILLGVLMAVSYALVKRLLRAGQSTSQPAFFFLGAGFMLVETKAITELGLTFGNTWTVIGAVICGVLVMAFIANWVTQALSIEGRIWPYGLLLASLAVGFVVSRSGGFPAMPWGRLATLTLLTCPILFSGLAFSSLLRKAQDLSGAMGQNVLGAMFGGVLEYHSMYFGFSALYLVAILLYVAAFFASLRPAHRNPPLTAR
jgi:SAM-dependent methyltransferase